MMYDICAALDDYRVPVHCVGRKYLAVVALLRTNDGDAGLMQLYAQCAAIMGTSPASVERSIRYAVALACHDRGDAPQSNARAVEEIITRAAMDYYITDAQIQQGEAGA